MVSSAKFLHIYVYVSFLKGWIYIIFSRVLTLLPHVGLSIHLSQYIFYISLINKRLAFVESAVQKINDQLQNNHFSKIKVNVFHSQTTMGRYNDLLDTLRDIYSRLWQTKSLINDCFGSPILFSVLNSFIGETARIYWALANVTEGVESVFLMVVNFSYKAVSAFLLINSCSNSNAIVCEIINYFSILIYKFIF